MSMLSLSTLQTSIYTKITEEKAAMPAVQKPGHHWGGPGPSQRCGPWVPLTRLVVSAFLLPSVIWQGALGGTAEQTTCPLLGDAVATLVKRAPRWRWAPGLRWTSRLHPAGTHQGDDGALRSQLSGAEQRPHKPVDLLLLWVVFVVICWHFGFLGRETFPVTSRPQEPRKQAGPHPGAQGEGYRERVKVFIENIQKHPSIWVPGEESNRKWSFPSVTECQSKWKQNMFWFNCYFKKQRQYC